MFFNSKPDFQLLLEREQTQEFNAINGFKLVIDYNWRCN